MKGVDEGSHRRVDGPNKSTPRDTADYRLIFEAAPGPHLILAPDLTIVAANNAYLAVTMTRRDQIVGRNVFEVFPDNPDDPNATGSAALRTSLSRVLRDQVPDTMAMLKYDIQRPASEGGGFEERYWSPVNVPAIQSGKLVYIVNYVQDVTAFIKQRPTASHEAVEESRGNNARTEAELFQRAQEIQESNARLEQAHEKLRESEEQFRLLAQSAREYAIYLLDVDGRVKTWS